MKKSKLILGLLFLIAVLVFLIVLLKLSYFETLLGEVIRRFGYAAVFILAFVVNVLEQPLSSEVPAGIAILFGLSFFLILFLTIVGDFLGVLVSFFIGRTFLSGKIHRVCSNEKKYFRYCKIFEKYGKLSLFLAAISPLPYTFFCWMSGAFEMKTKHFFLYGALPRVMRLVIVLGLVWWAV